MSFDVSALDSVPDPMVLDVNMLHATMVLWILEDLEGRLVVDHETSRFVDAHPKFPEEGSHPEDLSTSCRCRDILCLSG